MTSELDAGDDYSISRIEHLRYDPAEGTLDTLVDGVVREQMLIRQAVVEELTRYAVCIELRRLGYAVIEPTAAS